MRNKYLIFVALLILLLFVAVRRESDSSIRFGLTQNAIAKAQGAQTSPQGTQHPISKPAVQPSKSIKYVNTKYGFTFSLPATWKGYKIVADTWDGGDNSGPHGYEVLERGPEITLVNPQSTSTQPFQDVRIMVFSHAQWDSLQHGNFWVSAAPVGPGELGRNRKYVFAAPPRMINVDLFGYEEVMKIMQSNPLHPILMDAFPSQN